MASKRDNESEICELPPLPPFPSWCCVLVLTAMVVAGLGAPFRPRALEISKHHDSFMVQCGLSDSSSVEEINHKTFTTVGGSMWAS